MVSSGKNGKNMPKLVRLGNSILSSVLHSTEYLHHSFFLTEGRQPGGRPSDAHFLSVLLGTAVVYPEQMDHSLASAGGYAHLTRLVSISSLRNHFLL